MPLSDHSPYKAVFLSYATFAAGLLTIGLSTILSGAEIILAAAGIVISTAALSFLEEGKT